MNITAIFAYTSYFGAENANLEIFRVLKRAGHDLTLVTRHDIPEELTRRVSKEGLNSFKVSWGPDYLGFKNRISEYLSAIYRMITVSIALFRLDRKRKTEAVYVPNYLQFIFVWIYLLFTNKITVFRIGDVPSRGLAHSFMWKYFINPRVTIFICNSEYSKLRLLEIIGSKHLQKVHVIRNIYKEPFKTNAKKLELTDLPECLFIGQLNQSKGAHLAISAAIRLCKENENIIFSFVGQDRSGDELIKKLISDIKKDRALSSRIHFYGYISHDELKAFYSKAHVLLVPSIFEDSSPNVIVEARRFGLPVVAFPSGGISELVVHEKTGYLCDQNSMNALIEGIENVISVPSFYADLSLKSLVMPLEFQPTFVQEAWVNLFESLY